VLSFPWPLRLLFARQPSTLSRSLAVIIRAIETDPIHRVKVPNQLGCRRGLRTLLNLVIQREVRRLERECLLIPGPEQPWFDLDFHEPMDTVPADTSLDLLFN
jgi:hypothetical protein